MKRLLQNKHLIFGICAAFFSFFMFGFIDNLKGPTITRVISDLSFTYSQGGLIFFAIYLGFTIAVSTAGAASDYLGQKALLLAGSVLCAAGVIIYSSLTYYPVLVAAMLIIGLGFGTIEVGGNGLIVDVCHQIGHKGRYLLLLNFFHSLGAMLGPFIAGQLIKSALDWRIIYRLSLPLPFLLVLLIIFNKKQKHIARPREKISLNSMLKTALSFDMILFYVIILAYVGLEIGIASWIVEYLQNIKRQSILISAASLSVFFGCIMIGRLLSCFFVDRIGYIRSMLYCSVFILLCIFLGTIGPDIFIFCLPLTGLFMSIIFPTLMAAVTSISKHHLGVRSGFLLAFGGLGGMFGPYLLGFLGDRLGLAPAFSLLLHILALFILLPLIILFIKEKIRFRESIAIQNED